jgi:hypothetical protein
MEIGFGYPFRFVFADLSYVTVAALAAVSWLLRAGWQRSGREALG